jgi:hypothetical protein
MFQEPLFFCHKSSAKSSNCFTWFQHCALISTGETKLLFALWKIDCTICPHLTLFRLNDYSLLNIDSYASCLKMLPKNKVVEMAKALIQLNKTNGERIFPDVPV